MQAFLGHAGVSAAERSALHQHNACQQVLIMVSQYAGGCSLHGRLRRRSGDAAGPIRAFRQLIEQGAAA
jgi:hypothetical protein